MSTCPMCGASVDDEEKYCLICGASLSGDGSGSENPVRLLGGMGGKRFTGEDGGSGAELRAEWEKGEKTLLRLTETGAGDTLAAAGLMGRMGSFVSREPEKGEDARLHLDGTEPESETATEPETGSETATVTESGSSLGTLGLMGRMGRALGGGSEDREKEPDTPPGKKRRSYDAGGLMGKMGTAVFAGKTEDRDESEEPSTAEEEARARFPHIPDLILYRRSPRLKMAVPDFEVEIEAPPAIGEKPEINWLSTLLPVFISVAVAVVMMLVMSNLMMMLFSIPMAISGLVVTLVNYGRQVKKYREQTNGRLDLYSGYLDETLDRIEAGQDQQLRALEADDPHTLACLRVAETCDRTLWDRSPRDSDFGSVRIGSGSVPSAIAVKTPKIGLSLVDDELTAQAETIRETHQVLRGAPIVCDIRGNRICGVVGSRTNAVNLIRNMLLQYAAHHSYTEAKLICIYDEEDSEQLSWVDNLPHAMDEERKTALVAKSREEADRLLESLSAVLKDRKLELEADNSYRAAPLMLPYYLVVVAQPSFLAKDNPINEYLLHGPELGAGMLMAVENVNQLPKECNLILNAFEHRGEIFNKEDATHKRSFLIDELGDASPEEFSRKLHRIICEEAGKRAPLPKQFSFFQMQNVKHILEWNVGAHWSASDITAGISAPIGIAAGNELLSLDLHENAHGPHGLVAGTTGSGKSEVMLSYLLSLALRYHPYELGFVIIDFKGGGMANRLAELPHLIGTITNIEGDAINRSLASIKAELLKRQRLFAEAGVDSIDKYIRAVKAGKARTPLPHLVIIVDEFAELKAQQPEFMTELISAARIGRSLGIHLILATQKPAGQVSDQIWSNSRFQICLKVATKEDSNDVIKSPLALSIKEAGRAYLRVGNNEVFELFQSGYSGVKAPGGKGSQLEETVSHIAAYCRSEGIRRLPPICLPELETAMDYPARSDAADGLVPIGMADDPDNQLQNVQYLDVLGKNTMILGSALSGKTNLLQTVIRGLAESFSAAEVNIYILDFASMVLKSFEPLAHVGGVVTMLEDEKLRNLFRLLNAEIEKRRKSFLELGVSSFQAYLEAGRRDKPRILVIVDNLAALRELYFQEEDALLPLCQSGLTYGISVLATNTQTAGLGYKYMANFSNRIAMFCNDSAEYSNFFEHCTLRIPNVHGRCIVERDKRLLQCQTYRSFSGEREVDRSDAIRGWCAGIAKRDPARAEKIPEVPEDLPSELMIRAAAAVKKKRAGFPVGLDYETVSPVWLNLEHMGLLGLAGGAHNESRGLIRHLIRTAEQLYPERVSFFLADGVVRGLEDCRERPCVAGYEFLPAKAPELVKKVEGELARRYEALMNGGMDLAQEKLLILVLNGGAVIETVSADAGALAAFKNLVGKYKAFKVCVLLSECENAPINYSSPELLKKLKEEQKLVFFGDLSSLKLFDLPYTALKKFKKALGEGDAYLIQGSSCLRMKTPKDEVFEP